MVYESEEAKAALDCLGAPHWGFCTHSDELLLLFHRVLHSLVHDVNLTRDQDVQCAQLMEVHQAYEFLKSLQGTFGTEQQHNHFVVRAADGKILWEGMKKLPKRPYQSFAALFYRAHRVSLAPHSILLRRDDGTLFASRNVFANLSCEPHSLSVAPSREYNVALKIGQGAEVFLIHEAASHLLDDDRLSLCLLNSVNWRTLHMEVAHVFSVACVHAEF